jgi:hypothetical protein
MPTDWKTPLTILLCSLASLAYEVTLTGRLTGAGLTSEALFPPQGNDPNAADDTVQRWEALLEAGFPFVKGSVLRSPRQGRRARARVPPGLLPPAG